MRYKVIKLFTDLTDKDYLYNVGDTYPRSGLKPTKKRIAELSGSDNAQNTPLIAVAEGESTEQDADMTKQDADA